jgi:hypothetical protein
MRASEPSVLDLRDGEGDAPTYGGAGKRFGGNVTARLLGVYHANNSSGDSTGHYFGGAFRRAALHR